MQQKQKKVTFPVFLPYKRETQTNRLRRIETSIGEREREREREKERVKEEKKGDSRGEDEDQGRQSHEPYGCLSERTSQEGVEKGIFFFLFLFRFSIRVLPYLCLLSEKIFDDCTTYCFYSTSLNVALRVL